MKAKTWMTLFLSILLALSILSGCAKEDSGGSFSSFSADTLSGETFTQDDIEARDLTIVNFWGMFCNPCRAEMPDLAAYAKALPENVQLITICIDALDDVDSTKAFLESCGYEGVTLISGDENFSAVMESVLCFPTTVFVNSKGEIVGNKIEGSRQDLAGEYTAAVNEVLKEAGKAEIQIAG